MSCSKSGNVGKGRNGKGKSGKEDDEEKATRKRTSEPQRSHLISYMNSHPHFAKTGLCPGNQGKVGADRMWGRLSESLNAIGPAGRSAAAWKQTWHDLKKRIKQKAGIIVRARRKTGGESPKDERGRIVTPLTAEEEIVYKLCGAEEWVGQEEEEEIGLRQPSKIQKTSTEEHYREGSPELWDSQAVSLDYDTGSCESVNLDDADFIYVEDNVEAEINEPTFVNELEEFITIAPQKKTLSHASTPKRKFATSKAQKSETSSFHVPGPSHATKSPIQVNPSEKNLIPEEISTTKEASSKANDGQGGEKKRKRPPTIRETYEDTTSKYIEATNALTAAYQDHAVAVREQTEAIKDQTGALMLLKDNLSAVSEAVQMLSENLPTAIMELAYSLRPGNVTVHQGSVNYLNNNNKENLP